MTLKEVIERFDLLYPNALDITEKRRIISELDGRISLEIFSNYEGNKEDFSGYSENTPGDTRLLADFPFDDIYIKALCAENDAVSGDINRYNNSAQLFNSSWEQYASYYNRTHCHKNTDLKY
ncbi:MAG: hypothetical protein J1E34_03435 [Oscillospiraceae bacterium]|nr:hypothetical protein [Oscillospiraceae bacterium]